MAGRNREKVLEPRSRRGGWCRGCDGCIVQVGQRCPSCGCVHGLVRRHKRPTPQADEDFGSGVDRPE